MSKRIIGAIVSGMLWLLPLTAGAQRVSETTVKMGKAQDPGFVAQSAYGKQEVKLVLENKLRAAGLNKSTSKNGFRFYKGVVWADISANQVDLYYKIKGSKKKAKLYMLVSKGYDNFISSASDATIATNVTYLLQSLDKDAAVNREVKDKQRKLKQLEKQNQQSAKKAEKLRGDIDQLQSK